MAKDQRRSSRANNQTIDTFFILKDNIGQVIADIRADPELRSVVLDPLEPGALHYKAQLKVGEDEKGKDVLVDIVTLMLSGAKYFGCFDPKFKSEEYEQTYGREIMDVYERLIRIFSDNSEPKVRKYLERATPARGHPFAPGSPPPTPGI